MSLSRSEGTQWDVFASDCLSFHCRSLVLQARAMAGCLSALEESASVWFLLGQKVRAVSGRMRLPAKDSHEEKTLCMACYWWPTLAVALSGTTDDLLSHPLSLSSTSMNGIFKTMENAMQKMSISATAVVSYVFSTLSLRLRVISLSCLICGCLQVKSGSEIILQNLIEPFENLSRGFHLWLCNFRHCIVSPPSWLHCTVSFSWGSLSQKARTVYEAPWLPFMFSLPSHSLFSYILPDFFHLFCQSFSQNGWLWKQKNLHQPTTLNSNIAGGLYVSIILKTKGILKQCVFPAMTPFPFYLCMYLSQTVLSKANQLEGESRPGGTVVVW